jgi:hypothetical protein
VDWHAALAWQRITEALHHDCSSCRPWWVFLSYRMFARDEASNKVQIICLLCALWLLNLAQFPNLLRSSVHGVLHIHPNLDKSLVLSIASARG